MNISEKYSFDSRTQELLEQLTVPLGVYQFVDKRVVTLALSAGFCKLFGYDNRTLAYHDMDHNMYKDAHPDDVARIADAAVRFATEDGEYDVVYRSRSVTSEDYNVIHARGEHVLTDTGVRLAYVWYVDEGPYREDNEKTGLSHTLDDAIHEEAFLRANLYDHLTGLPNMTYFFERAEIARDTYIKDGSVPVYLYMDMCGMKFFNTKNGFAEGDKLLREFARLLNTTFGNENSCRIGADHFAALTTEDDLEDKLDQFLDECELMNSGNNLPVHIGVYSNSMGFVPVSTACDRAKVACDAIKSVFASRFNFYRSELTENAEKRQYILKNIDRAILDGWITVYYQPVIRVTTGKVCGEEALSRWVDPERGLLAPDEFVPYLEDAGQIYKLDLYVLEQILNKMKLQMEAGYNIVPHSINLSRSDFDNCDVVEEVRLRVDASGIDRDMINIEITESTISNEFEFVREQVKRFQSLGFQVWMDDFGSGYSSLNMLQAIRFDLIKFDMSLIRSLDNGDGGKMLLTELMRMANTFGMDTICEGVENSEQLEFLKKIGCSKIQGFYFSMPVPLVEILERFNMGTQIEYENADELDQGVIEVSDDVLPISLRATAINQKAAIYTHIAQALARGYTDLFYVNMDSDELIEFHTDDEHGVLSEVRQSADFFESCKREAKTGVHPDDQEKFLQAMKRDFLKKALEGNKVFEMTYRRIKGGRPFYVQMKVSRSVDDERFIVIAVQDIDEQVRYRLERERRQEEKYGKLLEQAKSQANIDALTGVKNKHSYLEVEADMDELIAKHSQPPFAIVMFDINDLKSVNDKRGHQFGDRYLKEACSVICDIFKHSPVFRVGGDEFTAISQGKDYEQIEELLIKLREHNEATLRNGGIVIACGMAKYEDDACVADVYARADQNMYEEKNRLKRRPVCSEK